MSKAALVLAVLAAAAPPAGAGRAVRVGLDPGLELLGVVESLAGQEPEPQGFAGRDSPSAQAARRAFSAFSGHAAVRATASLDAKAFSYMKRADLVAQLGAPPELAPRRSVPSMFATMAGGSPRLGGWLASLRDFASRAPFEGFFEAECKELSPALAAAVARKDYIGKIERYTGMPFVGEYSIVLSPFLKKGSQVNSVVALPQGGIAIKTIETLDTGSFGGAQDWADYMDASAWHELSHGILDGLSDASAGEIDRRAGLYKKLPWPCYDDWKQCVKEHAVRAVMIRLVAAERGERAAERERLDQGEAKYPYLKGMLERLRDYEGSRKKYPTLAEFFPRLLEAIPEPKPEEGDPIGGVSFEVDPRIELLSAVWLLGGADAAAPVPDGAKDYAADIRKSFAPLAHHAAVERMARMVKGGSPEMFAQILLTLSDPPALSPLKRTYKDGLASPDSPQAQAFLDELRDFAARSRFPEFYAAHRGEYSRLIGLAESEAAASLLKPEAAESYLRARFKHRCRFILAPILPESYGANLAVPGSPPEELRLRSESPGKSGPYFSFDGFASDVTHELIHTVTDPLVLAARGELSAYASLGVPGCADSWTGCVMEHVDLALTLRMLERVKGRRVYDSMRRDYAARGFPYLDALCERLEEFEREPARYPDFAAFFPRLMRVFPERLEAKLRQRPPAVREEAAGPRVAFKVDYRVELFSVLRLIGRSAAAASGPLPYEQSARRGFIAFSKERAVARTDALFRKDPQGNLPLKLMFFLSETPQLSVASAVPEELVGTAGGATEVDAFFRELRDFSEKSGFPAFFKAHARDYRDFAAIAEGEAARGLSLRSASEYLGQPLDAEYEFPLAPLLSAGEATNFTVRSGGPAREIRVRAGVDSDERGLRFLFDAFGNSVAHELIHTVTNPLASAGEVPRGPVPAGCNDQAGSSWLDCIQEHLVYAVTLRLLARDFGEAPYLQNLSAYESRGFPYLEALCERLKEYEAQRSRYPTLRAFYPRLAAVFREKRAPAEPARALPPAPADDDLRRAKDRGVAEFLAGRPAAAAAAFEEALKISPDDSEALLDMGVASEKQGDAARAMRYYDHAVASGVSKGGGDWQTAAAALSSRASLLTAQRRFQEARRDLRRAVELAPENWSGRSDLTKRLADLDTR
ncbi:MAG: DUF4932 domain-containing protein [Elusimicrobia bacterium]|nr:DUF4932 domain-containing protein [Elusimicrobiota bacterium]